MVNGTPEGYFGSCRGTRQGDPLFPYILVLTMEFLSIQLETAIESGKILPIGRANNNYISHFLFADDLLIFTRADKGSIYHMEKLLHSMPLNIGFSVNKDKSSVFFSKAYRNKDELKELIAIPKGVLLDTWAFHCLSITLKLRISLH